MSFRPFGGIYVYIYIRMHIQRLEIFLYWPLILFLFEKLHTFSLAIHIYIYIHTHSLLCISIDPQIHTLFSTLILDDTLYATLRNSLNFGDEKRMGMQRYFFLHFNNFSFHDILFWGSSWFDGCVSSCWIPGVWYILERLKRRRRGGGTEASFNSPAKTFLIALLNWVSPSVPSEISCSLTAGWLKLSFFYLEAFCFALQN